MFKLFTASGLLKSIVSILCSLIATKDFNLESFLHKRSKSYLDLCRFLGCKLVFSVIILDIAFLNFGAKIRIPILFWMFSYLFENEMVLNLFLTTNWRNWNNFRNFINLCSFFSITDWRNWNNFRNFFNQCSNINHCIPLIINPLRHVLFLRYHPQQHDCCFQCDSL